jgi:hypothetical protein
MQAPSADGRIMRSRLGWTGPRTLTLVLVSAMALMVSAQAASASHHSVGALHTTTASAYKATALGLPGNWFKGANLTSWWFDEWQNPNTDQSITGLAATKSTDAMFIATWYQDTLTSSTVYQDPNRTPNDVGLLRAMALAKANGMRPTLKVGVDVQDGSYRGDINPASVSTWFASYRTMVTHYAKLSQQAGATMLVVGSELASMNRYSSQWRSMIATARHYFEGKLTFAVNWVQDVPNVNFWDAVDYIGVDAYMPLSQSDPNPSVSALVQAWQPYVSQLAGYVAQWKRPAIFTEIGYQSQQGTAETPWWTTTNINGQVPQQRAYEAAYEVWSKVPWFQGFFWWDWRPGAYDPTDGGFSPRGKLAEQTMRAWNTGA